MLISTEKKTPTPTLYIQATHVISFIMYSTCSLHGLCTHHKIECYCDLCFNKLTCPQQYHIDEYDGPESDMEMDRPEERERRLSNDNECNGNENLHCHEKVCYHPKMDKFHGIDDNFCESDEEIISGNDRSLALPIVSTLKIN